jgi:hypothetical protein
MKKMIIILVLCMSFLLTGCEFLAIDAEIADIVKKGDYKLCDSLDTSENSYRIDKCYEAVAEKTGNLDICPKISYGTYKDECYSAVAIKKNDETICNSIIEVYPKADCVTKIAIKKADKTLCNRLNVVNKDNCFLEFAKGTKDINICKEDVTDKALKDSCILGVATASKSEVLCKEIADTRMKDDCYYNVAQSTDGNLLCAKIQDKSKHDNCFISFAVSRKDVTLCRDIEEKSYMWYDCIKRVAVETKDKGICKYNILEDAKELESCELQVNNAKATATT